MIQKQDLIDSIEKWAPGKYERALLDRQSVDQLRVILAGAVEDFVDGQQDRLDQVQADIQVEKVMHQLRQRQAQEPQRQAEVAELERRNRRIFLEAAKELGFATIEANYSLLVQELKELSVFDIRQFIYAYPTGGVYALVPATPDQIEQWTQERETARIKAHNQKLLKASPLELRELVHQEAEARRTAAHRTEVAQMIQTTEKRDAAIGFPFLPTHNAEGQAIDRAYLLRLADADIKRYRLFCTHYGSAAITARLNGVR
jgi:hypothetical protein